MVDTRTTCIKILPKAQGFVRVTTSRTPAKIFFARQHAAFLRSFTIPYLQHFPCEEDDEPTKQSQDKVTHKKPKVPRNKPSYNPFLLVPCRRFPSASAVPFEVIFQSDALVVIDVHSHLSTTEVIGLLGGTYCATERVLKVM